MPKSVSISNQDQYFESIDWANLRISSGPFIPRIMDEQDTRYFRRDIQDPPELDNLKSLDTGPNHPPQLPKMSNGGRELNADTNQNEEQFSEFTYTNYTFLGQSNTTRPWLLAQYYHIAHFGAQKRRFKFIIIVNDILFILQNWHGDMKLSSILVELGFSVVNIHRMR